MARPRGRGDGATVAAEDWQAEPMERLRARVRQGRLVPDEPTDLPEGTVLDLLADDEGDDLDDAERTALDRAITAA